MNERRISLEDGLYFAALLLAIGVRLANLGVQPLSESEANLALQSLHLAQGVPVLVASQPGYISLTTGLFFFFASNEFVARLTPALIGALIIFLPLCLRDAIGRKSTMVAAFVLALDPGLVAVSRTAGGESLALIGLSLAVGFVYLRKPVLFGAALAIFILGGTASWTAVLSIVILMGWLILTRKPIILGFSGFQYRRIAASFVGTLIIFGTLLFLVPSGFSALAGSLPVYIQGWMHPDGAPIAYFFVALLVYELLPFILGLIGIIRGLVRHDALDRLLGMIWLTFFIGTLINPSRQVMDLTWSMIPLWLLSVRQIIRMIEVPQKWLPTVALAFLTFIMLAFLWFSVTYKVTDGSNSSDILRLARVFLGIGLMGIATFLVGWGWSRKAALQGFSAGAAILLVMMTLSALWQSIGLGEHPEAELWRIGPYPSERDLLLKTVGDLSEWNSGRKDTGELVVVNIPSDTLKWDLRNYTSVKFVDFLTPENSPSFVITPDQQSPDLNATYTGQDFVWYETPQWSLMLPDEWMKWAIYRNLPYDRLSIIFWARTDKMPGAAPLKLP